MLRQSDRAQNQINTLLLFHFVKVNQKYLTFLLSLGVLLSVVAYFRMLHYLKEKTPPLEYRYSTEHKETSRVKPQNTVLPKAAKKSNKNTEEPGLPTAPESIDINNADKEQLMRIPGVGPKMADTLLDYMQKHGPFKKVEDLLEVPGIGPKKLERMKAYLPGLEGQSQNKKNGKSSAAALPPAICPKCGTAIPVDRTIQGKHEKPYCPNCLYYLGDEGPLNTDTPIQKTR